LSLNQLLVEKNIFTKVKLSFLPVGHTHDDVDQFFSKINAVVTRSNIITLEDLHTAVRRSFLPTPVCTHLDRMGMFAPWFLQYIEPNFRGTSIPRVFLAKRTGGKVGHFYRQQMQTTKKDIPDCWLPSYPVSGFAAFKSFDLDLNGVFEVPRKMIPSDELEKTVQNLLPMMTSTQVGWWNALLQSFSNYDYNACRTCSEIRGEQKGFVSCKNDADEVRKMKQRGVRQSTIKLQHHMADEDAIHPPYENWLPLPRSVPDCAAQDGQIHKSTCIIHTCKNGRHFYLSKIKLFIYISSTLAKK
jgi:hypothetical protein